MPLSSQAPIASASCDGGAVIGLADDFIERAVVLPVVDGDAQIALTHASQHLGEAGL